MRDRIRRTEGLGALMAAIAVCPALACAHHVERADLLRQIEAGDPPLILDVRSRGEFEAGHVPGALHVPFYSLLGRIDELPERDPAEPVIVYCEHGPRAGLARAQLWMAGDRPVLFLDGHMTAWKSEGLPLETEGGESDVPGEDD